jgi:serine phosphatase RsbU (regulator of sigma subunit)
MSKLIIGIYVLISFSFFAQNSKKIDSLTILLKNSKIDTTKINILHQLVLSTRNNDPTKAIEFAKEEVALSEKINFNIEKSYDELAWLYKNNADYKKSLEIYFKAEKYAQNFKSPKKEEVLAEINIGLASVYSGLNNYDLAITKANDALATFEKLNDTIQMAVTNLNIGNYHFNKGNYESALQKYQLAEMFFTQSKDSVHLSDCNNSIASALYQMKKYPESLEYFNKAYFLSLKNTPNDLNKQAVALQNLGQIHAQLGNYKEGVTYCLKAIELFKKLNDIVNIYYTYENLAGFYALLGDYQTSNSYYISYVHLKDSVFNEDTKNTIHEMSIKYESDKKEKENQVLTLENKNKKQVIYFAFGGCILLLGLVFFIFEGYKTKQKANQALEEKNEIINKQKAIVEEQHQDITDSIKYAERIQGAILPPKNMWQKILPNSFVLYMPKDVLSGDFYWIEETKDYIYVAAADCTGHGVPGALISIVNFNLLNKAVLEKGLVTPSEILDAVNLWLTDSLHQTYRESAVRDGMDVSLIAIHKHSNEVLFAGANNPIYIVSHGELKQIKGDKFPVGAFVEDQIQKFTTKRITVSKGDSIYLFSDGYADQFGGDNGKKYKYAPFQQKLIASSELALSEQRSLMKGEFMKWKGTHEQVDDVLLVGIKIV